MIATTDQALNHTPVSIAKTRWTVTANTEKEFISNVHNRLGTVLMEVRLDSPDEHGVKVLKN